MYDLWSKDFDRYEGNPGDILQQLKSKRKWGTKYTLDEWIKLLENKAEWPQGHPFKVIYDLLPSGHPLRALGILAFGLPQGSYIDLDSIAWDDGSYNQPKQDEEKWLEEKLRWYQLTGQFFSDLKVSFSFCPVV